MRTNILLLLISGLILFSCNSASEKSSFKKDKQNAAVIARGKALFQREDCGGCHDADSAIIGPSFRQLAGEYEATEANISHLGHIAIQGVKPEQGFWGSREMTPHPHLKQEDAEAIVTYMLSFPADPQKPFLHNTK